MNRTGLTFAEYVELRFRSATFPMDLVSASEHLCLRGYACRPQMLELLIENNVVTPVGPDAWSQANVDAASDHFELCQILTPYAAACKALGSRYADFLPPLRAAAERESAKYGRHIPADDQYFVMHRVPARDGNDGHPAIISFTLADDIRERLERGDEV